MTDMPIVDLCQQVGFCDQSCFGRVFRKSVDMTPGRYRRQFSGTLVNELPRHHLLAGAQTNLTAPNAPAFEGGQRKPNLRLSERILMKPGESIQ